MIVVGVVLALDLFVVLDRDVFFVDLDVLNDGHRLEVEDVRAVVGCPVSRVNVRRLRSSRWAIRSIVSCMRATLRGLRRIDPAGGRKAAAWGKQSVWILGGSHVMAAVIDENGEDQARKHERDIIDHRRPRSSPASTKCVAEALADAKDKQIAGIGIGAPGNIDLDTGTIRYSPNFGWKDVALGEHIREAFKLPVFVGNDARCATLGRAHVRRRQGRRRTSCC